MRPNTTSQTIILVVLLALLTCSPALALIRIEANGSGDYPTIQAGLNAAASGDTLELGNGIYTGAGNRDLVFGSHVVLKSRYGYKACVLDCQGSAATPHRGFELTEEYDGTVLGLTVKNAYADNGAAIQTAYGNFIFEDCLFQDNHATNRGGVWYGEDGAQVNFRNCVFSNNSATNSGGALCGTNASSATIQYCTFVRNGADSGGSLYLESDALAEIDNSIIAFTKSGDAFDGYYFAGVEFNCSNLYMNTGGNWTNGATGLGTNGNITADPLFVDPMSLPSPDVRLTNQSPCRASETDCSQRMGAGAESSVSQPIYGIAADGSGLFTTISQAAANIPAGALILLEDGNYSGHGYMNLNLSNVSLASRSDTPEACVLNLSGHPGANAFWMDSSLEDSVIKGITIANGYNGANHVVVLTGDQSALVQNCIFDGHYIHGVGGVFTNSMRSGLSMVDCRFTNNLTEDSTPLIRLVSIGTNEAVLTNCEIRSNTLAGPAIGSEPLMLTINDCVISDNSAPTLIDVDCHEFQLSGTISNNQVGTGSLMDLQNGSVDLENCEILDNTSAGGMVVLSHADVDVNACLFRGNEIAGDGGGLQLYFSTGFVRNSRFEGNVARIGGGLDVDVSNGLIPYSGSVSVWDCEFLFNQVQHYGAAVMLSASGCYFEDPTGYSDQSLDVRMDRCTFHNNSAESPFDSSAQIRLDTMKYGTFFPTGSLDVDMNFCLITDGNGIQGIHDTLNHMSSADISCSNIHGNDGGDWVTDWLVGAFQSPANISVPAQYCDAMGGDLSLADTSPCLAENSICNVQVGANGQGCAGSVGVEDLPTGVLQTGIGSCYPNPFNPSTTIGFSLASQQDVSVLVYDLAGRVVRTLVHGETRQAGRQEVVWDGRSDQSGTVAAGVYFVRLIAGGDSFSRKIVMIK